MIARTLDFRRHHKNRIIKKRRADLNSTSLKEYYSIRMNSLSKQHPLDCGNTRCLLCHFEKIFNIDKKGDKKFSNKDKVELDRDI
jgi:hypothetical protein